MSSILKLRRGSSLQINAAVPDEAELWFNTDTNRVHAGDGVKLGGTAMALAEEVQNFQADSLKQSYNRNNVIQAIDLASAAKGSVYIPAGAVNIDVELDNPYGVQLEGPGYLKVPVKPGDLSKGRYRYKFNELDRHQRSFGHEYLHRLREFWRGRSMSTRPKVLILGNSTHANAYITDPASYTHNQIMLHLKAAGFAVGKAVQIGYHPDPAVMAANAIAALSDPLVDIVNIAVSGSVAALMAQQLTSELIAAFDWFILGGGINDQLDPDGRAGGLINASRTAIQRIRNPAFNGGTYFEKTITLKIDCSVANTEQGRDETQQMEQRKGLRRLARKYQCHCFDTQAFLSDARGSAGKWDDSTNPPTSLIEGRYDSFRRMEPTYYNPAFFDDDQVHPLNPENNTIWGTFVFDVVGAALRLYAFNRITFDTLNETHTPADPITAYDPGLTVHRAKGPESSGPWPGDGHLETLRRENNSGWQMLTFYFPVGSAGVTTPQRFWRTTLGLTGLWTNWEFQGVNFNSPSLQGGFTDSPAQGGFRIVRDGNRMSLDGAITGGTRTFGVAIADFGASSGPFNTQKVFVCAAGDTATETANLILDNNGVLRFASGPASGLIWLDSISWVLKSSLGVT